MSYHLSAPYRYILSYLYKVGLLGYLEKEGASEILMTWALCTRDMCLAWRYDESLLFQDIVHKNRWQKSGFNVPFYLSTSPPVVP